MRLSLLSVRQQRASKRSARQCERSRVVGLNQRGIPTAQRQFFQRKRKAPRTRLHQGASKGLLRGSSWEYVQPRQGDGHREWLLSG